MKERRTPRKDSPEDQPFRQGDGSARVNFRQQSLAASKQQIRQLNTQAPAARPTFRITVG